MIFNKTKRKNSKASDSIKEIDVSEVSALKTRLEGIAESLNSESDQQDILLAASLLEMLLNIYGAWNKSTKTIKKLLRKFFGKSSEKATKPLIPDPPLNNPEPPSDNQKEESPPQMDSSPPLDTDKTKELPPSGKDKRKGGNGRNSQKDYTGAENIFLELPPEQKPGQLCPGCIEMKLFGLPPKIAIKLVGNPIVSAYRFIRECSGCNCGEKYTAPVPKEYEKSYDTPKYGPSAVAAMIISKFLMAVPYGLLDKIQSSYGVPLPASTQINQIKKYALTAILAIQTALKALSANAYLIGFDDTEITLLEKRVTTKKTETNKGYGTAVLASGFDQEDNVIALYDLDFTKHAGTVVMELLALRDSDKSLPKLISDGLKCYRESKKKGVDIGCNSHARRKIYDEDPDQQTWIGETIIKCYGVIYTNDRYCKNNNYNPLDRQNYHILNSTSSFEMIKIIFEITSNLIPQDALNTLREDYKIPECIVPVEPNDPLTSIADYFLSRYRSLTEVLRTPGIPLDTNYIEQAIKAIIKLRKMSFFFHSLESAKEAGAILTVSETTRINKVNVQNFLEYIIENSVEVIKNPKNFLPWLYDKSDDFKKSYWDAVKKMNVAVANSVECSSCEHPHSDRLVELQGN